MCNFVSSQCFGFLKGLQNQNRIVFFIANVRKLQAQSTAILTDFDADSHDSLKTRFKQASDFNSETDIDDASLTMFTLPEGCNERQCDYACNNFFTGINYNTAGLTDFTEFKVTDYQVAQELVYALTSEEENGTSMSSSSSSSTSTATAVSVEGFAVGEPYPEPATAPVDAVVKPTIDPPTRLLAAISISHTFQDKGLDSVGSPTGINDNDDQDATITLVLSKEEMYITEPVIFYVDIMYATGVPEVMSADGAEQEDGMDA